MNWAAVVAFGIPWVWIGARIVETRLAPATVKVRRQVARVTQRRRF